MLQEVVDPHKPNSPMVPYSLADATHASNILKDTIMVGKGLSIRTGSAVTEPFASVRPDQICVNLCELLSHHKMLECFKD